MYSVYEDPLTGEPEHFTEEMLAFRKEVQQKAIEGWNMKETHADCAVRLLFAVVRKLYDTSLATLVARSSNAHESTRFSTALNDVAKLFKWGNETKRKYVCVLKKILSLLPVHTGFLQTLKAINTDTKQCNGILGTMYDRLEEGSPAKGLLDSWIEKIREDTRNSSDLSIRHLMSFILNSCLPSFGLSIENWPDDPRKVVEERINSSPELLTRICSENNIQRKARWLRFFLNSLLAAKAVIPSKLLKNAKRHVEDDDDGSDKHRISAEDLDKIYKQSKNSPRDHLLYLVMITTGLRVGGASRILTRHIAEVRDQTYHVRTEGRTKEKGNKWATFTLTSEVRELVFQWLTQHRRASESPYLFPGLRGGCISTQAVRSNFRKICSDCGLDGGEFHPHALRHSFAHILLESGNSVDLVSKCLNHSNSSITEAFYLKESAAQVTARASIPWMQGEKEQPLNPLPTFLGEHAAQGSKGHQERKRRKIDKQLQNLEMFKPL